MYGYERKILKQGISKYTYNHQEEICTYTLVWNCMSFLINRLRRSSRDSTDNKIQHCNRDFRKYITLL